MSAATYDGPPEAQRGSVDSAANLSAERERSFREWIIIGVGLTALIAILAAVTAVVALATGAGEKTIVVKQAAGNAPAAALAAAPTLADAKGVEFEPFERVSAELPAVPAGKLKKFDVDVYHHVTQVSKDLAPTEVWSYKVNGVEHRGTGYSEPMVVEVGDTVDFKLTNGSDEHMQVTLPHSLDFHAAEVNPGERYADLAPGKSMRYRFVAGHPGVYMYHCATKPVLMHTGMGMVGAMVVKPRGLAPAHDLMITQQEYYLGEPGKQADMNKMAAKTPDVITFNGYANQYADEPIVVKKGERIRMWVLNAGPSIWSAFHVIGTVFDKAVTDNGIAHDVQTVNLAPSQGGYVELTLAEEGTYPFVTHAFGDMVKGAMGVLKTEHAPAGGAHGAPAADAPAGHDAAHGAADASTDHETAHAADASTTHDAADVNVTLGDMYVKADTASVKAGEVTFAVTNEGQTTHGMALALQPVSADGGMLDESALLGKGNELAGGDSDVITTELKSGNYELVCFLPGHYAAGQKLAFEVTG